MAQEHKLTELVARLDNTRLARQGHITEAATLGITADDLETQIAAEVKHILGSSRSVEPSRYPILIWANRVPWLVRDNRVERLYQLEELETHWRPILKDESE